MNPYLVYSTLSAVLFGGLFSALLYTTELPLIGCYLIAVSALSVFLVGLDKSLSRSSTKTNAPLRIPEAVLFFVALLGGSASTFVAMQIFRHKTKKAKFHFVLLVIFGLQVALFRIV